MDLTVIIVYHNRRCIKLDIICRFCFIVNIKCALEFVRAFEKYTKQGPEFLKIKCMQEYYDGNK